MSEPTARKYLNELVEAGVGVTEQDRHTTRYKRDEGQLVDRRIEELRTAYSHRELVERIREMKESTQEFRETYNVEGLEDFASKVEPATKEEGRGSGAIDASDLAIAKATLQVDGAHRFVEA